MARPARVATVTSERTDWSIEKTLIRVLKTGVSVGLKAVLVLKATNR